MPNAKVLEKKQNKVQKIVEDFKDAKMIFFIDYKGITVEEDKLVRKSFREANITCEVIKNSIIKRATDELKLEGLSNVFEGSTLVVVSKEDYVAGPKIANDFAKAKKYYKFKAGIMDGKVIEQSELIKIASLPSRELLLAKLATALIGNIRNVAVVLDQIAKKNEVEVSA